MAKGIEKLPIQTGGWGASVEDDRQSTVILGWESLEVRELATIMLRKLVTAIPISIDVDAQLEQPYGECHEWCGWCKSEESAGTPGTPGAL